MTATGGVNGYGIGHGYYDDDDDHESDHGELNIDSGILWVSDDNGNWTQSDGLTRKRYMKIDLSE